MGMSGAKIIRALEEAQRGDFIRVTVDGQHWVQETALRADLQAIMGINNRLRETLLEARQVLNDSADGEDVHEVLAKIDAVVR
jgi:DNA-binding transcriptional regulator LsrR (DeoR family)